MNIGLLADTQGRFDVDALVTHVAREFEDVDEIWHAGDWGTPAVLDGLAHLGHPLVVVNGNAPDDPRYPMTIERTVGRWHVVMVHNLLLFPDLSSLGGDSLPLVGRDRKGVLEVIIHGHTHRWRDELVGRTRFINPGTATKPQFGGTERTMARLIFDRELLVEKLFLPKFAAPSPLRRGPGRGSI